MNEPPSSRRMSRLSYFLLFSLHALKLVLFCPNPDSLHSPSDTFDLDVAEPPSTPSPLSPLRRHTSRFYHLSSPLSLSQDDAFTLTASSKNHTIRLISDIAEGVNDQTLTQTWASRNGGVPLPSADILAA